MIIYLDLDGVIINWVEGVCNWYNIPYEPEKVTAWDIMPELTKTSTKDFWNNIKNKHFWQDLKTYPHADSFIKELKELGTVIIISSPAHGCAGYRQNWIQTYLPDFFYAGHYILTPSKWFCAHNNTILIDDSNNNCEKFFNFGYAITYPQPWNKRGHLFTDIKEKNNYVINRCKDYII